MTLNEAFSKLITQQAWYKNSGYLKERAIRDKRYFLAGENDSRSTYKGSI